MKRVLGVTLSILGLVSSSAVAAAAEPAPATIESAAPSAAAAAPAGHPCSDFYGSVCDGRRPGPSDLPTGGPRALAERNRNELKALLEEPARDDAAKSGAARRVGDFYAACMDEAQITGLGLAPLRAELDRIAALHDRSELPALVAHLEGVGVPALITLIAQPDPRRGGLVLPVLLPGATGLPDPDLYVDRDAQTLGLRGRYLTHLEKMFELAGSDPHRAAVAAAAVLRVESALARASIATRDPQGSDPVRELKVADLSAIVHTFDWPSYFAALGVNPPPAMVVATPAFLRELGNLLAVASIEQVKAYLTWQLIHSLAELLPKPFGDASFSFFGSVLADLRQPPPRWQRCVGFTQAALPQDLGRAYVDRHFGEAARKSASALVESLEHALEAELSSLQWLEPASRTAALAKLHAIRNRVGYPDHWPEISGRHIERNDALGNWERSRTAELHRIVTSLGKPPDRAVWAGTAAASSVLYDPGENALEVPAGLLQPPLFTPGGDSAVNLGAAGALIGRELLRGFDASGRQLDATGQLHDWWSRQTTENYAQHAECFGTQLDQFERSDDDADDEDVASERAQMLQEILGDAGALRLASHALRAAHSGGSDSGPAQRLYTAFGELSCGTSDASGDPGVARLRVDAVLSNLPDFAAAFSCGEEAPMVHAPTCSVW